MTSDLPPHLRGAPFHVADARAAGVSERRLQHRDLARPHRGVRSPRDASDLHDRCARLLPVLPDGVLFSHATAAGLWGLPVPLPVLRGPLHVASGAGHHPRRPGVVAHRVGGCAAATVRGLPVVEPTRAWGQCSELLQLDELVALGDALAGRWSGEPAARGRSLGELDHEVGARGSRRGARRLREARGLVRANVWSPKETELRLLLVRAGLPEPPALNREFRTAGGAWLGTVDLAYPEARLALEYEGDHHRTDRAQWRRDIVRRERFADAGWRTVRVTDDDLDDRRSLVARVTRHLGRAPPAPMRAYAPLSAAGRSAPAPPAARARAAGRCGAGGPSG